MIKFFRKIRQRFLEEGKFYQYLKYALGEIILVVIGILIALSINNWNIERQERIQEQNYLHRIKAEMQKNLVHAKRQVSTSNFQIENVDHMLSVLNNGIGESTPEQLFVSIEILGWYTPISYDASVWTELINNGEVRLIQNDTLRDLLAAYHTRIKATNDLHVEWRSHNLGYQRLVRDLVDPATRENIASRLLPTHYNGNATNLPPIKPILDQLKSLKGIQGFLAEIKMGRRTNVSIFQRIHSDVEDIIGLCETEEISSSWW